MYTFNQKNVFTGLFDFSVGIELLGKEIVKCIDLAKDGIHAVIVVFSVRTRFTEEEEHALRSVQKLFGSKIVDHMIVVFTGGDELEENEETLEDYLGRDCPEPLKVFYFIINYNNNLDYCFSFYCSLDFKHLLHCRAVSMVKLDDDF